MSETIIAAIIMALATVAAPVLVYVLKKRGEREPAPDQVERSRGKFPWSVALVCFLCIIINIAILLRMMSLKEPLDRMAVGIMCLAAANIGSLWVQFFVLQTFRLFRDVIYERTRR
jgi:hypothetical protein